MRQLVLAGEIASAYLHQVAATHASSAGENGWAQNRAEYNKFSRSERGPARGALGQGNLGLFASRVLPPCCDIVA